MGLGKKEGTICQEDGIMQRPSPMNSVKKRGTGYSPVMGKKKDPPILVFRECKPTCRQRPDYRKESSDFNGRKKTRATSMLLFIRGLPILGEGGPRRMGTTKRVVTYTSLQKKNQGGKGGGGGITRRSKKCLTTLERISMIFQRKGTTNLTLKKKKDPSEGSRQSRMLVLGYGNVDGKIDAAVQKRVRKKTPLLRGKLTIKQACLPT